MSDPQPSFKVTIDPASTGGTAAATPAPATASTRAQVKELWVAHLTKAAEQIEHKFPFMSAVDRVASLMDAIESVMEVTTGVMDPSVAAGASPSTSVETKSAQPKKKPIRAYIDGCFDIMHSGHYNAIRQAKQLTDILVVGVHSDAEIIRNKGPPVMNEKERLALVKACKWVDEIVFDTPYDPSLALLDKYNCDFCVHGDDTSTTADGQDAYQAVRDAGRLRVIKRTEGISTTDLVGRLLLMTKTHHVQPPEVIGTSSPMVGPVDMPISSSLPPFSLSPSPSPRLDKEPNSAGAAPAATDNKQKQKDKDSSFQQPPVPQLSLSPRKHYSQGVSTFLPTTWRISQFSNHRAPKASDKIVYIDGSFDLFHVGHVRTIEKAKALGTFLYVGIHDDKTVNRVKGKNYPIMNLHERVLNVLSCKFVDEVVIGAPWVVTRDLIKVLNISVVVCGANTKYDTGKVEKQDAAEPDPYAAPRELGVLHTIGDDALVLSTDDVVDRIIKHRLKYIKRNQKREKKDLAYIQKREFVAEI